MADPTEKLPKVFISYSWSSAAHEQRVLDLANRLIGDGIPVVIDKYDLQEGQDLHKFMERMVNDETVTHVLVVTDRAYAEKANNREKGVGKEALIISAEVFENADQTKFLPIVFESVNGEPCRPAFLNGRIYIDMSTAERAAENYAVLVRRLFGKPLYQKPPLGKPPAFLLDRSAASLPTAGKAQLLRNAVLDERSYAEASIEDYFSVFCESLEQLRIDTAGAEPLDDRVMASIESFTPYRNEFIDVVEFLARYRNVGHTYETVATFFESASAYLSAPAGAQRWDDRWSHNYKFVLGELFLHVISVLIRRNRFAGARALIARDYRFAAREADGKWQTFPAFFPASKTLERDRQMRLGTNWVSATAELLKNRATGRPITFDELMQSDLVLFLASLLEADRTNRCWMPFTLLYAQRWQPLDVFARAESKRFFSEFRVVFGAGGKDELLKHISDAAKRLDVAKRIFISSAMTAIDRAELAALEKLDTRP